MIIHPLKAITILILLANHGMPELDLVYSNPFDIQTNTTCPPESEKSLEIIQYFLTDHRLEDFRKEAGVSHLKETQIELLSDQNKNDHVICEELNSKNKYNQPDHLSSFDDTYYRVGDYYFIAQAFQQRGESYVAGAYDGIVILDKQLSEIKSYGVNIY